MLGTFVPFNQNVSHNRFLILIYITIHDPVETEIFWKHNFHYAFILIHYYLKEILSSFIPVSLAEAKNKCLVMDRYGLCERLLLYTFTLLLRNTAPELLILMGIKRDKISKPFSSSHTDTERRKEKWSSLRRNEMKKILFCCYSMFYPRINMQIGVNSINPCIPTTSVERADTTKRKMRKEATITAGITIINMIGLLNRCFYYVL